MEEIYTISIAQTQAEQAAQMAEDRRIQEETAAAIAAIEDERERALVEAVDRILSLSLGSADGYIPSIGSPETRRLQAMMTRYGVTPDYGASFGLGHRVQRYPVS